MIVDEREENLAAEQTRPEEAGAIRREPNWLEKDIVKQATTWMEYRTEPATWGDEITSGLRWGMGIADVADQLPALEYAGQDHAVEDCQRGFVTSKIGGLPVTIGLHFQRGALYRVMIDGTTTEESSKRTHQGDMTQNLHEFWRQAWRWRKDRVKALREKYGKPDAAPDLETRREFCDDLSIDEPCGESAEMEKALRWSWIRGGTEIMLVGGRVPRLTYSSTAVSPGVDAAEAAWRRSREAKPQ